MSHQRRFKVWCWRRGPGGGHDAVDGVLLLGVDVLHVERGAVLGMALGLLGVKAAVHATVAILCKERVDGFYSGLSTCDGEGEKHKTVRPGLTAMTQKKISFDSPLWVFPEMFLLPLASTHKPANRGTFK